MEKNDESSDSSSSDSDSNVEEKSEVEEKNSWEEESSSEEEVEEKEEKPETDSLDQQQDNDNEKEGSSDSSSGSGSSSSSNDSSGSEFEEEVEEEEKPAQRNMKGRKGKDNEKKVWEENPDVYGIRRSNRQRKEPSRLAIQSEGDSDEDEKPKKARKRNKSWIPTLSESESGESDSSYDAPKKRVPKKRRQVAQRKKQQRGRPMSTSSDDFGNKKRKKGKAAPARGATNKVSYKEDSEDATDSDDLIEQDGVMEEAPAEDVETIEKVVRHRQGWPGQTGAKTTLYSEEYDEIVKRGDPDPEEDETELQYLIKWKSWSHLHNTWETRDDTVAQGVKGLKKLDNYIKRMDEIAQWKSVSSPEDIEYFDLQQEMNEDIQKQYQIVERVISHKFTADSTSSYPDYLCKWQGLPYSECTWEDGTLTARFFQDAIDQYLERERSDTIPNKNAKCLRQRPKFSSFKTQPDFIGTGELKLRDYQLDGVNWLVHAWCRDTSVILADEMGLGKTIQTISFLSYLFHKYSLYGPFLVVVPLSTMDAWEREFRAWAIDMNVIVYIGDVNSRTVIQEQEWCFKKSMKLKFNVLLTTYEMLLRDKDFLGSLNWACLLIDEAHRLKNEDSLLYKVLIEFRTNFRFLITGTPLQNSLKELYALLHFMMPTKFDNWEEFEGAYSVSDKDGLQKLHRDLEPFLIRRVKKDVEKSLPAKVEQILRVEMSQIQKQIYKLILTRNVQELCKELKGSFGGLLNIIVELKKCCNHSTLIKPLDPDLQGSNLLQMLIKGSGKMILLDKLLCRLKETGHRVLVFSQMVRMLDIMADYLYLKRFPFQRLDGSVRGEQRQRALDHFNAEGSQDFCFLLSTRAGGLGINLASADTVIIFDSDWNPQNDLQAMARAHRIGQKNQVNIYRFVTKNSIEENIIERAKKKMVLDHLIIQRMDTTGRRILSKSTTPSSNSNPFNKEELSSILKFGAEDLFRDHDQDADQKLHAMDIDEILQRAEMQENTEDIPSLNEDLLSQFKVVNYAAFNEEEITAGNEEKPAPTTTPMQKLWNEIIPEEELKKAEEAKKEETILKPRSRKTVMNIAPNSKRAKSKEFVATDTSSTSSSDGDGENNADGKEGKGKKTKKRKAKAMKKDGVKGFTDVELRRFIKSFKKFSRPLTRLDAVSQDAELTDKSTSELQELGNLVKTSCEQAVKDYQEKLLQDEEFDGKKKGASLKISGVTINAPSVLKAETDLEPLSTCLPSYDSKQLKSFRLTRPTRSIHWGIPWGVVEDSMLLAGMLFYGMGNWDAIKSDQALGLTSKILPVGNGKPQNKHLMSRGEYLLRLLKEQDNQQQVKTAKNTRKKKSKAEKSAKSAKSVSSTATSSETQNIQLDEKPADGEEAPKKEKKKKKEKTEKKKKKDEAKSNKKSATAATSSVAAASKDKAPSIEILENRDMDEATFKRCKEKMRPEKKSLQLLHQPDEGASEEAQVQTTKKCLLKIGDHIEKSLLYEYQHDPHLLDTWRSNLWSFVAKFTELGAQKLFKLYRTASRKRDDKKKEIQKMKASYSSTLYEVGKKSTPAKQKLEEARKRTLGIHTKSSANKIPKIEMKIPHRKHHSEKQADHDQMYRSKYGDNQQGDNSNSNSRTRDNFGTKEYNHRDQQQRGWNDKPHNDSASNNDQRSGNRKSNDENSNSKALTYREWKDLQLKRAANNEKQKHDKRSNKYRDKRVFGDEKPPHKQQHSNDNYYSSSKSRHYRESRDTRSSFELMNSPANIYSPSTLSQSPLNYGTSDHHWSRKRTFSNNSDTQSSSNKRIYQDIEQISPSDSIGDKT